MANQSSKKLTAMILIAVGIGLVYWGYEMSGSFGSQFSQAFSGSSSNDVLVRYAVGAVSFISGLFLFVKK